MGLGSRIRDPEETYSGSRIPDLGSATMVVFFLSVSLLLYSTDILPMQDEERGWNSLLNSK
jgi:hypothetical protein